MFFLSDKNSYQQFNQSITFTLNASRRWHLNSCRSRGSRRLAKNEAQVFEYVLNDPVLGSHVREDGADEYVAAVLPVAEDLAATQVLDAKAQEPVLLVRLEHGGGRVRAVIGLA